MIKLKKISCAVMSFVMLFAMSTSVFAAEKTTEDFSTPQKSIVCQTNLDEMDLSKSFTLTESYTDNNGTPITITSTFKQALQTRGSSTTTASAGSWTSKASYGIVGMSYEFDLSKSGSQWKISHGRNFSYFGALCKFSNPQLKISRAVSTNSSPAEIDSSVVATVSIPGGGTAGSSVCLLNTKVSKSGVVTTTWN